MKSVAAIHTQHGAPLTVDEIEIPDAQRGYRAGRKRLGQKSKHLRNMRWRFTTRRPGSSWSKHSSSRLR